MNNFIFKKYIQFIERNGYFPMMFQPYNCSEITDISPTLTAQCGSKGSSATVLIESLGGDEIKEFYILRYERTEYAKRIRKDYESKRIKERRCNMRKWGIRHDGLCNTLSTVQKDNYLLEVTYKDDKDMNNEPFIVASRGRNPENPSDRTTGSPTEQRLEPNTKGLCNTLTTVQKDSLVGEEQKILVKQATKKGYAEAVEGDSVNVERPNSKTRRGRVGKQVAQTLTTSPQQGVVEAIKEHNQNAIHQQDLVQCATGVCRTIPAGTHGSTPHLLKTVVNYSPLRIRKLTPKECWRLMGFDDEDFYKAEAVNSNTQLYKQAGNSIVVDVLEAIFTNLKPYLSERNQK